MFRIHIYLNFLKFVKAIFIHKNRDFLKYKISNILLSQTKKHKLIFSSQCRISFLYLLKYLRQKKNSKNEIIFSSYNLPEMVNVAKNLNFKIKYCDLNPINGFIDIKSLNSLISKKTAAVVYAVLIVQPAVMRLISRPARATRRILSSRTILIRLLPSESLAYEYRRSHSTVATTSITYQPRR